MRLLIDTDPGIDDALALLYALATHAARIDCITTVSGNVDVAKTTSNTHRILAHAALSRRIPVFQGCAAPLVHPPVHAPHVHGDDGLAGLGDGVHHPSTASAVEAILDAATRFPKQITVVALGPLTNLATAFRLDATTFSKLKHIVIMGGAWQSPGNITPFAEFNFYADPHAVRAVLESNVPRTILPLNITHQAELTEERLTRLLAHRTDERASFIQHLCGQYFRFYREKTGAEKCYLHDPLCMAIALTPALARYETVHLDIDVSGSPTRGELIAGRHAAELVTGCDFDAFFKAFEAKVCHS